MIHLMRWQFKILSKMWKRKKDLFSLRVRPKIFHLSLIQLQLQQLDHSCEEKNKKVKILHLSH